jgi:hypothetical protein
LHLLQCRLAGAELSHVLAPAAAKVADHCECSRLGPQICARNRVDFPAAAQGNVGNAIISIHLQLISNISAAGHSR